MITMRKTPVAGRCNAKNCTKPPTDGENPYGLCAQHWNEWEAAGRPELALPAPKEPKAKAAKPVKAAEPEHLVATVIEPARSGAARALEYVANLPLLGDQRTIEHSLAELGKWERNALQLYEHLESQRKDITGPILESKYKIDALFKPATQAAMAIKKTCIERLENYERQRRQEQRNAAFTVGASTDPTVLALAHHAAAPLPPETVARTVFSYRVTDAKVLALQIAAQWPELVVERFASELTRFVTEHRGQIHVPGLESFEDVKVRDSGGQQ